MTTEPQIKGLSDSRRKWFFRTLLLIFIVALPVVIFYTTGYRLNFDEETAGIVTTGGIYVDTETTDISVFLDEEQYDRPRLFQSAYYLQNVPAGQHRVVVNALGGHTWVKELPVDPYIVTEAAAFNVPVVPRLRPITQYQNSDEQSVYFVQGKTKNAKDIFKNATSTAEFQLATSTKVSQFDLNPEYDFVQALFASSSNSSKDIISVFADNAVDAPFKFAATETEKASTTEEKVQIVREGIRLYDRGWEVYAAWEGKNESIPHYYCADTTRLASTSERYGEHVASQFDLAIATPTGSSTIVVLDGLTCRTQIQLDHLQQDVYSYDFFPNRADLVLLRLENGLYVTEIDDRAWQNTQPLLLGQDFMVLVENDLIYIKRDGHYFELVPEIDSN